MNMSLQNINLMNFPQDEITFKSDLYLDFLELSDLSFSVSQLLNTAFDKVNAVEFLNNCNLFNDTVINWDEISNEDLLGLLSKVDEFVFDKLIEFQIISLQFNSLQEIFNLLDGFEKIEITVDQLNSASNIEDLDLVSYDELFDSLFELTIDDLFSITNENFYKLVRSVILLKLDELDFSEFIQIEDFGSFKSDCELFFLNKFSPLNDENFNHLINASLISDLLLEDCNQLIFIYLEGKQDSFIESSSNIESFQLLINEHNLRVAENKADGDVNVLMNLFSAFVGLFNDNLDGFTKLLEKYLVKLFDKVFKGRFEKLKLFLARKIGMENLLVRLGINFIFSSIPVFGVVLANAIDKYLNSYSSKTIFSY